MVMDAVFSFDQNLWFGVINIIGHAVSNGAHPPPPHPHPASVDIYRAVKEDTI